MIDPTPALESKSNQNQFENWDPNLNEKVSNPRPWFFFWRSHPTFGGFPILANTGTSVHFRLLLLGKRKKVGQNYYLRYLGTSFVRLFERSPNLFFLFQNVFGQTSALWIHLNINYRYIIVIIRWYAGGTKWRWAGTNRQVQTVLKVLKLNKQCGGSGRFLSICRILIWTFFPLFQFRAVGWINIFLKVGPAYL